MPGKHKKNKTNSKVCNNNNIVDNENNNVKDNSGRKTVVNQAINITLAGYCAVCWNDALYYCSGCHFVGYCCMSHMASHQNMHQNMCWAVEKLIKNTGFLYEPKIYNPDEWRYLRIRTLENIKKNLQRNLEAYERDLLLFPKHCAICYETDYKKLVSCKQCHQVWHCLNKPDHIPKNHSEWCKKLQLFSTLVRRQAKGKLFMYDMNFGEAKKDQLQLNTKDGIEKAVKQIVKDSCDLDECEIAMISQACSGPLTMLYAIQISNLKVKKSLTIHLIGAELHYEGKTLQAWESFFMHFLVDVTTLKIVMVGPELNASTTCETVSFRWYNQRNWDYLTMCLGRIGRILTLLLTRLCEGCRKNNKKLSFEYKDCLLYHEYATSKSFIKPDIVCAFNPGLHRSTGFNQNDTWPHTIQSAVSNNCPFIFTAYTAYEAPLDLKRVQESASVHVIHAAKANPFASLKPDRNFISDHEAPLIFKNYYLSIVTPTI